MAAKPKRSKKLAVELPDIFPRTEVSALDRRVWAGHAGRYEITDVAPLVGMQPTFITKVTRQRRTLSADDVLTLLDQDAYGETFVRRSQVLDYLERRAAEPRVERDALSDEPSRLVVGEVTAELDRLPMASVQCVVTSTPYWGMRIYKDSTNVSWADGEIAVYGHEQTPEGFIRHTIQILHQLRPSLTSSASVWWNIMDTYNTRTQIRGNAYEALLAMSGQDKRGWLDHDARRLSAGHAYLKDGEQAMIPARIAERASRIGYFVRSMITWAKWASLPEPQNSRVSRGLEYIVHLSPTRTPKFDKAAYRRVAPILGGRNVGWESDKLGDVWVLPTTAGKKGHGAQFPTALPGRCIALSTDANDLVLDPFVGGGSAGVAARALNRRFLGIDVSAQYISSAEEAIAAVPGSGFEVAANPEGATPQNLPMVGPS